MTEHSTANSKKLSEALSQSNKKYVFIQSTRQTKTILLCPKTLIVKDIFEARGVDRRAGAPVICSAPARPRDFLRERFGGLDDARH